MVPDYDATALTSQGYTTVTVCVNGVVRTILSEIRVVDGTTVVTVDAYQFPENAYYTLTLPTRDPTFPDLPKYEIPAWLREQRRRHRTFRA